MRTCLAPVGVDRRGRLRTVVLLAIGLAATILGVGAATASAVPVNIVLAGAGTGTVTSVPAGIDCGNTPGAPHTDCSFNFARKISVTLTASPDPGAAVLSWSGNSGPACDSGRAIACQFTAPSVGSVTTTVRFDPVPDHPPNALTDSATGNDAYTATLHGRLNPTGYAVLDCHFDYGTSTDYGSTAPCSPADPGTGSADVAVSAKVGLLRPDTTYHYRLAGLNLHGSAAGVDRTFTTAAAPADSCPNASIRTEQGVSDLPNCRALELVSNVESFNTAVTGLKGLAAGDGTRVAFSGQFFGDPQTVSGAVNPGFAHRTSSGWTADGVGASPGDVDGIVQPWNTSVALDRVLFRSAPVDDWRKRNLFWQMRNLVDGELKLAAPVIQALNPETVNSSADSNVFTGGSASLDTFVFGAAPGMQVLPGDPAPSVNQFGVGDSNLYLVTDARSATPSVSNVARLPNGTLALCGAYPGGQDALNGSKSAERAVSWDGGNVYFSTRPAATVADCSTTKVRLFKRVDNRSTVAVSQSECTRTATDSGGVCSGVDGDDVYGKASVDGSRVFFSTSRQLTNSDTDATADLYLYDATRLPGQRLLQVSAGETTASHPTVGSGANVQGVVDVSADGSRVYFVATGVLTDTSNSNGEAAMPGQNNLYVFQRDTAHPTGRIGFVATLSSADESILWSSTSTSKDAWAVPVGGQDGSIQDGDGRFLVFGTKAALVPADQDTAEDIYRYSDTSGKIVCVSCQGNGPLDAKIQARIPQAADYTLDTPHVATEDVSTVVVTTREPLNVDDLNQVFDAYMWRDGKLTFLSRATGDAGANRGAVPPDTGGLSYVNNNIAPPIIDPSGDDVYFLTTAALTSDDNDTATDVYVARTNGGFASPPSEAHPCDPLSGSCQPPPVTPLLEPLPGSTVFSGLGNVVASTPPTTKSTPPKLRVSKVKTVRGTSTRIKVRAPGKGKIRTSGAGLRRSTKTAKRAGTYRVAVRLSKRSQRKLRRKHRVRVRVTVRFTAAKGQSSTVRVHVTFKPKRHRAARRGIPQLERRLQGAGR